MQQNFNNTLLAVLERSKHICQNKPHSIRY